MTKTNPVTSRKKPRVPARSSTKSSEQKRLDAYERLGVLFADVTAQPQITHILAKLPGGINKAVEFLRGSADDDARRWLSVYDSLPETSRKLLPFEAFCLAANLTTKRTLEIVTGACFEQSASTSALLAAASHPDIVTATIKGAKNRKDGGADRKMMHLHAGFLPVPKNQTTIISPGGVQQNVQLNDNSKNVMISAGEVPRIEDKMAKINNRFNTERLGLAANEDAQKLLSEGESETQLESTETEDLDVDAEFVDQQ